MFPNYSLPHYRDIEIKYVFLFYKMLPKDIGFYKLIYTCGPIWTKFNNNKIYILWLKNVQNSFGIIQNRVQFDGREIIILEYFLFLDWF